MNQTKIRNGRRMKKNKAIAGYVGLQLYEQMNKAKIPTSNFISCPKDAGGEWRERKKQS
jgi:hypothetical protein